MRISDWSSDVCSSDLGDLEAIRPAVDLRIGIIGEQADPADAGIPIVAEQRRDGGRPFLRHVAVIGLDVEAEQHAVLIERLARVEVDRARQPALDRSEEHTSELQSLMRNSYAVFCLKK